MVEEVGCLPFSSWKGRLVGFQDTIISGFYGKIPCRMERLPTAVLWPGEFHGLYGPWSHKESDTTERLSLYFTSSRRLTVVIWRKGKREGNHRWLNLGYLLCMYSHLEFPFPWILFSVITILGAYLMAQ